MKFLVDQNLPASLATHLTDAGQDARRTRERGLEGAAEGDLSEWFRRRDAVLVPADKRLTKYLASQRAASPSVIIAWGYLLDFPKLAADVLEDLDAVAQVIGSDGHAVLSMGPDRPTRAQLLPLVSEAG